MLTQTTFEIQDDRREHRAPNFTLPTSDGGTVTLFAFAGRKRVLLFFPSSPQDPAAGAYAETLAALKTQWEDLDAVLLPILPTGTEAAAEWSRAHARGYPAACDADNKIRERYYRYFELDAADSALILLDIYCAPLVVSHARDARTLISPDEISKWLNVLVCACSE